MISIRDCSDISAARFGAIGLAAVLVLSGCSGSSEDPLTEAAATASGGAQNGQSPNPGATGIPSVSPTPSTPAYKQASAEGPAENVPLPVMPEVAKEKSKEGLEAFGEHWFSSVNYGYETGDASLVRQISAPGCERCELFYLELEEGYANEDWIQGGSVVVVARGTEFVETPQGRFQLILSIQQDRGINRGPNGIIYDEAPADSESTAYILEASYVSDHWVTDLVDAM